MKSKKKPFDVGIYTYRPILHGEFRHKDEVKLCTGDILAVLHPVNQVDGGNDYCFDVSLNHGTLTVLKKNLRFNKVITLAYDQPEATDRAVDLHLRLNVAQAHVSGLAEKTQTSLVTH